MELNVVNGMVEFVLLSGSAKVANKMTEGEARELLRTGRVQKKGNQIVVDDKFVFEIKGAKTEPTAEEKEEPKTEPKTEGKPVKSEDKPLAEAKGKPLTRKPRKKAKK